MLKTLKGYILGNQTASQLFYDDASSVSDWSNEWTYSTGSLQPSWVPSASAQIAKQQQQQYQQLKQWQYMQTQNATSTWGYVDSAKEIDRQLLEKVRHRAEHYAVKLLLEAGCA
jgi:hypothetical protein